MCQHSHYEETRAPEANGGVISVPRPMGRRRSLPRRYFLRGGGLFGQPRCVGVRYRRRCARAGGDYADLVPQGPRGFVLLAGGRRKPPAEGGFAGGLGRDRAGRVRWTGLVGGIGLVDPAICRPDCGGRRHDRRRRVTTSRNLGARVGYSRVGFLAHRPCLLWRSGADAPGPRRVRGLVLPELRSVGVGTFSCGLKTYIISENALQANFGEFPFYALG